VFTPLASAGSCLGQTESAADVPTSPATQPATSSPAIAATDIVIRLRGLPYQAAESEVRSFLGPTELGPKSVHMIREFSGRPTGDCVVELNTEDEAEACMAKHREVMGTRYVEVFRASNADVPLPPGAESVATEAPQDVDLTDPCVRMRGLPFSAGRSDVELFLTGLPFVAGGIHLVTGLDGRATGEAYVQFETKEGVKAAMGKNRSTMGTRYIELFESTRGEMVRTMAKRTGRSDQAGAAGSSYNGLGVGEEEAVVRLRGLPFSATEMDVVGFFSAENILERGIHMIHYPGQTRPSGEAYVECRGPGAVKFALSKHREMMGTRFIEVYQATRTEMMMQLGGGREFADSHQSDGPSLGAHAGYGNGIRGHDYGTLPAHA
jgi:hypothetical protein